MNLFGDPETERATDLDDGFGSYEPEEPAERFMHPRLMDGAKGFEEIEKNLISLFEKGRMPHGLIFAGPKGIGKATFAYALARFLLKHGDFDPNQDSLFGGPPELPQNFSIARDDRVFSLVASGAHPDLLSVERAYDEGKNKYASGVAVADIRKVNPFLRMTASDGGWRVVIIDDADTMNRSAQNALLKILEEPPENTLLVLISHRLGALIPTIKSRTQTVHFNPPSQALFNELLSGMSNDLDTLYAYSRGSIGNALEFIEQDGLELLPRLLEIMSTRPKWNWVELHKLGDELAKSGKDERYQNFTELLNWIMRQAVRSKARARAIEPQLLNVRAVKEMIEQSSLEELLEICDSLSQHFRQFNFANLDKKQAVLRAFHILGA